MRFAFYCWLALALFPAMAFPQEKDSLRSAFLFREVRLELLSSAADRPASPTDLLLVNDGQDLDHFRMQAVMDSLAGLHLIGPLLVVGIEAGDRLQEYGVSSRPDYQGRGAKAGAYDSFVVSELLPFLRRRTSLEFRSLTIAGCSLGGLSAFDIAWNHPEIFQRVGVFSGSFWWRDKDLADPNYSDEKDRILYAKIHDSPRHARMACWFYVGQKEETADRNHNGIIDAVEDTRDLVRLLQEKNICRPPGLQEEENPSGTHDYAHWSEYLPHFLLWAFGKRSRPDHPFREMLLAPLECDSLITASPR